ncbi:MAG: ribonuclease P protein component [Imperialibacter sp.]|uniref:ribonuclease P protein component n=1 Tax=Imperialibacter sp. TaxID=2038411 RepID=UPI0032EFC012
MKEQEYRSLPATFSKSERLKRDKRIKELFQKGSSFFLYPLLIKYMESPVPEGVNQILFSVSKKNFKRAVDRNLLRRRMFEAYRLHKHTLTSLPDQENFLLIAYIYVGKEKATYQLIERQLIAALKRLNDVKSAKT